MLGNTKGKMINQYVPDYVLYDLETTGTSSKYDEVKFGCIIKRNSQSTKFPICRIRLQINQFSIQPVFLHKGIVLT